jgi:hypothetical protein
LRTAPRQAQPKEAGAALQRERSARTVSGWRRGSRSQIVEDSGTRIAKESSQDLHDTLFSHYPRGILAEPDSFAEERVMGPAVTRSSHALVIWLRDILISAILTFVVLLPPPTLAAGFHGYSVAREQTGGSGFTGIETSRYDKSVDNVPSGGCVYPYTGTPVYQTQWVILNSGASSWRELGTGHQCEDLMRYWFWGIRPKRHMEFNRHATEYWQQPPRLPYQAVTGDGGDLLD